MSADERSTIATLLANCGAQPSLYNEREAEFLRSVAGRSSLTPPQLQWLTDLAKREELNFEKINAAALAVLEAICRRWLPDGVLYGKEWVARNPLRSDGKPGSFRINVHTGKWADFALSEARGGDPISLAAYLFHNGDQRAAAASVKRMVGL